MFDFSGLIRNAALASLASGAVFAALCAAAALGASKITAHALGRSKLDRGVSSFLSSASSVVLWTIAVIIAAESFGIPVGSLIAALGVVGLALSLSIQNLLSNLFSGAQIISTRPFSVGDYVEIGGVSGTVSQIKLFQTKLKTPDNRVILVPNSEIVSSKITNYSTEPQRRIELRFAAPADAGPAVVKGAVLAVFAANDRVLREPAPFVGANSFGDGRIEYVARAWAKSETFWDVCFELNEAIPAALLQNGVALRPQAVPVNLMSPEGREVPR